MPEKQFKITFTVKSLLEDNNQMELDIMKVPRDYIAKLIIIISHMVESVEMKIEDITQILAQWDRQCIIPCKISLLNPHSILDLYKIK